MLRTLIVARVFKAIFSTQSRWQAPIEVAVLRTYGLQGEESEQPSAAHRDQSTDTRTPSILPGMCYSRVTSSLEYTSIVNFPTGALPVEFTETTSRTIVEPTYATGTTGPPCAGGVSLLA